MAHKIKLERDHQDLVAECLLRSLDYKRDRVIKNPAKLAETERQYADAISKITKSVICGQHRINIFTWIADQIRHSGPLRDQELGRRVLDLCQVCAQDRYTDYISDRSHYHRLFNLQGDQ